MPNIEIHGFSEAIQKGAIIRRVIAECIPEIMDDVVITIVPSTVKDLHGNTKPFIRVLSPDHRDEVRVAMRINKELGLNVEWIKLGGFFEGKN